jgi:hypothetical protein
MKGVLDNASFVSLGQDEKLHPLSYFAPQNNTLPILYCSKPNQILQVVFYEPLLLRGIF